MDLRSKQASRLFNTSNGLPKRTSSASTGTGGTSLSGFREAAIAGKSTISKDNTGGEGVRRASLLSQYGQKTRRRKENHTSSSNTSSGNTSGSTIVLGRDLDYVFNDITDADLAHFIRNEQRGGQGVAKGPRPDQIIRNPSFPEAQSAESESRRSSAPQGSHHHAGDRVEKLYVQPGFSASEVKELLQGNAKGPVG